MLKNQVQDQALSLRHQWMNPILSVLPCGFSACRTRLINSICLWWVWWSQFHHRQLCGIPRWKEDHMRNIRLLVSVLALMYITCSAISPIIYREWKVFLGVNTKFCMGGIRTLRYCSPWESLQCKSSDATLSRSDRVCRLDVQEIWNLSWNLTSSKFTL